jgi:hypothetical protein
MKVEPCPFCGGEVRFDLGDLSAKCSSCFYTGPTDDNEAAAHNRLSRIVRAAEEYVMAREAIPGEVFAEFGDDSVSFPAYEELKDAVEGGRSDG